MARDMDGLSTFNEILRGEVEHGRRIINSMAIKISEYEGAAHLLSLSPGLRRNDTSHQVSTMESSPLICDDGSVVSVTPQASSRVTSAVSSQESTQGSPYAETQGLPPQGILENDESIPASGVTPLGFGDERAGSFIETGSPEMPSGYVSVDRLSRKRKAA